MANLNITTVKGGTVANTVFVAIKEAAQKKHAPRRAIFALKGTDSIVVVIVFGYIQ